MSSEYANESQVRQRLSALADGACEPSDVAQACRDWRDADTARAGWHEYQLIGDVLRSEDLASAPGRDAAFLAALRERLAAEPVVLAPSQAAPRPAPAAIAALPARAARGGRWSWMAPSAVAAGFVAVAGALLVTRGPSPADGPGTAVALSAPAGTNTSLASVAVATPVSVGDAAALVSSAASTAAFEPEVLVANGQMIRDARLDRYLAAHKQFAGSSVLGVPSNFLRSATTVDPADR